MESRGRWFALAAWGFGIGLVLLSFGGASPVMAADEATQAKLYERIQKLIGELGSPQYATRERAQAELLRIGLPAFDPLYDAQTHSDLEIALRARYLVGTLRIAWTQENDAAEVKVILRGYQEGAREEREARLKQLSELEGGLGWPALCRVIRFERSEELSKRAALLLMQAARPADEAARQAWSKKIVAGVAQSRRAAADWARALAVTLRDPVESLAAWNLLVQAEQEVFARDSAKTSRQVVRDLLRWQAELLARAGRAEESLAASRRTLEMVEGTRQDILEAIDWLMAREAWVLVEEVGTRFQAEFAADATLLYRLAEARLKHGRRAAADETAEAARAMNKESGKPHIELAVLLQERGLFDWAEQEYRLALDQSQPGQIDDIRSRLLFSEMLFDIQQPLAAAKVLQTTADAMEKDMQVGQMIQRLGRDPGSLLSRMHFFYARHYLENGDRAKAIAHLDQATDADPTDADALIARYRIPNPDPKWHERTKEMIASAASDFAQEAENYERQLGSGLDGGVNADYFTRQAAQELNQFAWLVGNTEGDFDAAVRASHRSNELRPDSAGYLDTLARCYYAKKDYVSAVKHQSQALKLEPHSGQMQRQLALFQKALDEAKAQSPPPQPTE